MTASKGLLFIVLILVAIVQCTPTPVTDNVEAKNSTSFTLSLYKAYFNENENTVISPMSFRILLSLIYQASSGQSGEELCEKLYLGDKSETLRSQSHSLSKFSESPNIKIVNKVYIKENSKLKKDFSDVVASYKSAVEQVDFKKRTETVSKINQWVEEQTNHQIKNLVSEDVLTDNMALLLLNSIYFKAAWQTPFNIKFVRKSNFNGIDGKNYSIDFMLNIDDFRVAKVGDIKAEVLELPYKNGSDFLFWIILPNEDSSISEVTQKLSYDSFNSISGGLSEYEYSIRIPLFEIESTIDGKKLFEKIGVHSIFENSEIDLLESSNRLKVDQIKQKTKIIVNTDGTEASTSTFVNAVDYSIPPSFIATRPFIYVVLTADTKEPIFIGHFSKPNEI